MKHNINLMKLLLLNVRDGGHEEAIKAFARLKLASYKVPRRVLFFAEDELKTTGNAKIKTADLRKLAAERLAAEG